MRALNSLWRMGRCVHAGTVAALALVLCAATPSKPAALPEASTCRFDVTPREDSANLKFIQLLGPTLLLATDNQCLYSSENGGRTFQQVRCVPFAPEAQGFIRRFYFVDRAVGWAMTDEGVLLHTRDGGAQWEALFFPDTEGVLHTRDSGPRWDASPLLAYLVRDVHFANAQTGFWVGEHLSPERRAQLAAFMTRDGGQHWSPVKLPSEGDESVRLEGVWMRSASETWVVGGRMLMSTNSGQTWRRPNIRARVADELRNISIQFGGGGVGWILRHPADNYLSTCDGGKSWVTRSPPPHGLDALVHTDCKHAYALSGGRIFGSRDGGRTFQRLLEGGGAGLGYGYSTLAYLEEQHLLVAVSERTVATCQLDAP